MWPSEVTFTRTPRSTHPPDAHARRVASPGSATAGEGEEEEEEDDDGRRSSATESDHDDPYSPKAGEAGEVEIDAELNADEYEDRQSTWVRVSTALPPRNSSILRTAHLPCTPPPHPPPPSLDPLRALHLTVQMCVVCSEEGRDSMGAVSSMYASSQ